MPSVNIYTKEQVDAKVPDTTGASVGDVLTVGTSGTEWSTPSSGGMTIHTYSTWGEAVSDIRQHPNCIIKLNDAFAIFSDFTTSVVLTTTLRPSSLGGGSAIQDYVGYNSPSITLTNTNTVVTFYSFRYNWYNSQKSTSTSDINVNSLFVYY